MLIYLDICCFNRPFDDQSDLIVRLQTEAKLHVQEMIRAGVIDLVWSAVMDIENSANPDFNRKAAVADWQRLAVVDLPVNETVEEVAELLSRIGVKPMDALHVACAIEAHAEYFLTTDNALLRKMVKHGKIRVVDPVDFVRVLKVGNDEN
jgi:predicted nucleic acid-binding protein